MRIAFQVGIVLLAAVPWHAWHGDTGTQTSERLARLIKRLGHSDFVERETATQELEKIGEAALPALRQAHATTGDAEVRARARQVIEAINRPLRAAAAKKELARWQGEWFGNGGQKLIIKGDRWVWGEPGPWQLEDAHKNRIEIIEVGDEHVQADLILIDPAAGRKICRAIFRLGGDTLHYCGTYDPVHPTEFRTTANTFYVAWQRANKGVPVPPPPPPPVEVDLHSEVFATDMNLAESKTPIHRVLLTCQIANGGSGKLTLDPNGPKFDEFGQPIADGQRLPEATLNVTLKLVKKEAGLQRYEIRGPKIASRMYLVAGAGVSGRLLVHGKDGKVRYRVNLQELQHHFPPCHPGCFPAGTLVQVPGGTKAIDRIREGDLVITLDADGKPSPVKVTGVFKTRNRILMLRTEDGQLLTTATQPIAVEKGGFAPAGELKPGDRIWRWTDGKRRKARVLDMSAADRETDVFNLILGEATPFIAGGFVVRSKPPAALMPVP